MTVLEIALLGFISITSFVGTTGALVIHGRNSRRRGANARAEY